MVFCSTIKSLVFEGQLLSQLASPDELFCGRGSDQCEDGPEDHDPGQVVQRRAPRLLPIGVGHQVEGVVAKGRCDHCCSSR